MCKANGSNVNIPQPVEELLPYHRQEIILQRDNKIRYPCLGRVGWDLSPILSDGKTGGRKLYSFWEHLKTSCNSETVF